MKELGDDAEVAAEVSLCPLGDTFAALWGELAVEC